MDPFVQLDYKGKTFRTTTIQGGGKDPRWNESFSIPVESLDDDIRITCFDEDLIIDDLVGSRIFKAEELCKNATLKCEWIILQYK